MDKQISQNPQKQIQIRAQKQDPKSQNKLFKTARKNESQSCNTNFSKSHSQTTVEVVKKL